MLRGRRSAVNNQVCSFKNLPSTHQLECLHKNHNRFGYLSLRCCTDVIFENHIDVVGPARNAICFSCLLRK